MHPSEIESHEKISNPKNFFRPRLSSLFMDSSNDDNSNVLLNGLFRYESCINNVNKTTRKSSIKNISNKNSIKNKGFNNNVKIPDVDGKKVFEKLKEIQDKSPTNKRKLRNAKKEEK